MQCAQWEKHVNEGARERSQHTHASRIVHYTYACCMVVYIVVGDDYEDGGGGDSWIDQNIFETCALWNEKYAKNIKMYV